MSLPPLTPEEKATLDKKFPRLRVARTVGALIVELQRLPPELRIKQGFEEGVLPLVFNRRTNVHLSLEENDGTWDADESEADP